MADLADLMNLSPDDLQRMLAQLRSPEDVSAANSAGWLATGLGLMANANRPIWQAIGAGGLTGIDTRQQELQRRITQRGQDINQLSQLNLAAKSEYVLRIARLDARRHG